MRVHDWDASESWKSYRDFPQSRTGSESLMAKNWCIALGCFHVKFRKACEISPPSLLILCLISRPSVPEAVFQRNREAVLKRELNRDVIHAHAYVDSVSARMVQGRLLESLRVIIVPTPCGHKSFERFQFVPNRFLKHDPVIKARVFVATVLLTLFLDRSHNLVHGVFVDIEKTVIWKVNDQNLHQVTGF
jgi:hypothetical protein